MDGIVTVLPSLELEKISGLIRKMYSQFGQDHAELEFYPHFSYHVAESYEEEPLAAALQRVAEETAVFTLIANGIGIFPGPKPVIYIPLTRTGPLNALHQTIWHYLAPTATNPVDHYHPANWFPHITLDNGHLPPETLGAAVQWLNQQTLLMAFNVTNLTIVRQAGDTFKESGQYALSPLAGLE